MISRREFVGSALGGALAALSFAQSSMGKAEEKGRIQTIGLQLYTVRRDMEKDFDGTLAKVAAIGFKEVEFAGYFNRTPEQVKAALAKSGLSSPSAHVMLQMIRNDWGRTVDTAKAIGQRYLILGWLSPEERKAIDDYKRLADVLNRAGEQSKKAGIQLGYHNHDFEFEPLEGQIPYDLLLKGTDPDLVKMELDLYWITKANQQPEKYFAQYPGRFHLFHVKDMDNTSKRFFTEVGRGTIDFKRIFKQAKQAGVKHYFVEQDETAGSAFDSIKVSYDYLRRLSF